MDFVQRNLINERNNLQVELAKAKAIIAQLSEGMQPAAARANDVELARLQRKSKIDLGVRGPHKEGEGITPAGEGAQNRRLAQQEKAFPMAEQAEYISDLENVIISIAEQLGVHPNDLLDEGILGNVVATVKHALGINSPEHRAMLKQRADNQKKHDTEAAASAAERNSPRAVAYRKEQDASLAASRKRIAEKESEPKPPREDDKIHHFNYDGISVFPRRGR